MDVNNAKGVVGSGRGLIEGDIPEIAWTTWRKRQRDPAEIRIANIPSTSENLYTLTELDGYFQAKLTRLFEVWRRIPILKLNQFSINAIAAWCLGEWMWRSNVLHSDRFTWRHTAQRSPPWAGVHTHFIVTHNVKQSL